jgi:hypothetical protein
MCNLGYLTLQSRTDHRRSGKTSVTIAIRFCCVYAWHSKALLSRQRRMDCDMHNGYRPSCHLPPPWNLVHWGRPHTTKMCPQIQTYRKRRLALMYIARSSQAERMLIVAVKGKNEALRGFLYLNQSLRGG